MIRRVLFVSLILVAVLLPFSGCSNNDGNEWQRLVCEVESVNGGVPLVSAYLNVGGDGMVGGGDDSFPIDYASILFRARPYSTTIMLPEDGPNSWFHITGYDLIWQPGPNAPAGLTDYNVTNGLCDAIVPVNDEGLVTILIADRVMKEEPWYLALTNVAGTYFTAPCELIFRGHESGNTKVVEIPAGLMVTFVGAVTDD